MSTFTIKHNDTAVELPCGVGDGMWMVGDLKSRVHSEFGIPRRHQHIIYGVIVLSDYPDDYPLHHFNLHVAHKNGCQNLVFVCELTKNFTFIIKHNETVQEVFLGVSDVLRTIGDLKLHVEAEFFIQPRDQRFTHRGRSLHTYPDDTLLSYFNLDVDDPDELERLIIVFEYPRLRKMALLEKNWPGWPE